MPDIIFPPTAITDKDKASFLYRILEKLRLAHNQKGQDFLNGIISKKSFRSYQATSYEQKVKMVFLFLNPLNEKLGRYKPDKTPEEKVANSIEQKEWETSTKWDSLINLVGISKIGLAQEIIDPTEDLTTYTETDPNAHLAETAARVTWTDLARNEDAYLTTDKGVNFFDGSFTHLMDVNEGSTSVNSSYAYFWGLTNFNNDDLYGGGPGGGNNDELAANVEWNTAYVDYVFTIREQDGASQYTVDSGTSLYADDTTYYAKIVRDESVGVNGTLYLYVYSNSARTTQVGATLSTALHTSNKDFRYVYACSSFNTAGLPTNTGYMENLDLQIVAIAPNAVFFGTNF